MLKKCTKCGELLNVACFVKDPTKKDGLYSSCKECYRTKHRHKKRVYDPIEPRTCHCGKSFTPRREQIQRGKGLYCSQKCKGVAHSGRNHPSAKERTINSSGYVLIRTSQSNLRREHRVVAERAIGRPLESSESVHHIDGIKTNNAVKNLFVCNKAAHAKAHLSVIKLLKPLLDLGVIWFDKAEGVYRMQAVHGQEAQPLAERKAA